MKYGIYACNEFLGFYIMPANWTFERKKTRVMRVAQVAMRCKLQEYQVIFARD